MSITEPQLAEPKPRRRWLQYGLWSVFLLMLTSAVLVVAIAFIEGVLGYDRSGVVPTLGDLPEIGPLLAGYEVDGPVAYWFSRHPHGTYNYFLCGHASERQINSLCERLRLSNRVLNAEAADEQDTLNNQIREVAHVAGRRTYWKGPFQIGDAILLQD